MNMEGCAELGLKSFGFLPGISAPEDPWLPTLVLGDQYWSEGPSSEHGGAP